MTFPTYACIYHPSKPATVQCKRCKRFMCITDTKVAKSMDIFNEGPTYIPNRTVYCIPCLPQKIESDANQIKIIIGVLLLLSVLIFPITISGFLLNPWIFWVVPLFDIFSAVFLYYYYKDDSELKMKLSKAREEAMEFSKTIESEEIKQLNHY